MHELYAKLIAELHSAWRFRWLGIATAWVVSIVGWAVIAAIPNTFEANARVYVDSSSVLEPFLNNRIVATDIRQQLALIQESLFGYENLEEVASKNHLIDEQFSQERRARIVEQLKDEVEIYSNDYTDTSYFISYSHSDREIAIGVVSSLLEHLVADTLGADERGTATTEQFLDERIAEYELRLQTAEKALADFKKKNSNRLPGAEGGYFDRVRAETTALETRRRDLRLAESRRDQILAQLNNESPPPDASSNPSPDSLDGRIRYYQAELDRLLLSFTDRHPDVTSVRETIARLQAQKDEQMRAFANQNPASGISTLDTNPVYQSLRIALNDVQVEIASLQADINDRSRELATLEALIDEIPDVEAELARLNRDYDVIYEQYQAMVQSRETQQLSRKAANTDKVDFHVIDPPSAAVDPSPDRVTLMSLVFIVSLGAGTATCWLIAQLKPVFHDIGTLREVCGLPILGSISQSISPALRSRRKYALVGFTAALTGLALLFAVAVLYEVSGPGIHSLKASIL